MSRKSSTNSHKLVDKHQAHPIPQSKKIKKMRTKRSLFLLRLFLVGNLAVFFGFFALLSFLEYIHVVSFGESGGDLSVVIILSVFTVFFLWRVLAIKRKDDKLFLVIKAQYKECPACEAMVETSLETCSYCGASLS